jgi:hypothetical protein
LSGRSFTAQHADRQGPSHLEVVGVTDVYLIEAAEAVSGVILSRHEPLPVLLGVRRLRRRAKAQQRRKGNADAKPPPSSFR